MNTPPPRRLAVILHADVVGSTRLVQHDEALAHQRMGEVFERLAAAVGRYGGTAHEVRGDALVAEFERASDAVCAALAFQLENRDRNATVDDEIRPRVRVGLGMGEVIVADDKLTGAGVVLAQRVEQLAPPEGVCVTAAVHEAVPRRLPLDYASLGERELKGFDEPVRVYRVETSEGAAVPPPEPASGAPIRAGGRKVPAAAILGTAIAVLVLVGGLLAWWQPWAPDEYPAAMDRMAFSLPGKPSIAVLAFDNLSGDADKGYLADGLSENIITELSRFSQLFVISRQSAFSYKGKPVKAHQVAEELGVRYVLDGSVPSSGDRIRVTAQLINAIEGNHVWAERYDRQLSDFFAVQDEITRTIVATLSSSIDLSEFERLRDKPPALLSAYEAWMRGGEHWFKSTPEDNEKARELAERALALDPEFAGPHRLLAWVHINGHRWGWSGLLTRERSLELAREHAEKAVALAPFNHRMHQALAAVLIEEGRLDEAVAAFDRSFELNPNDASVLAHAASPLIFTGRSAQAVPQIERAIRLNPYHPNWYLWNLGFALYFTGDYEKSVQSFLKMKKMPNLARRQLAASYVRLGRMDEARAVMAEFLENAPDYTVDDLRLSFGHKFTDPALLERLIEDVRAAGMPDPSAPPEKPSITVLPFDNLSGDPEQSYFADGIAEDVMTDLSRVSGLTVIARNSAFAYRDHVGDLAAVAEALGARYFVRGSVRRFQDKVRINAQLLDSRGGTQIWADRFDRDLVDVFAIQDEVTRTIVDALELSLTPDDRERLSQVRTASPDAYDMLLRGLPHMRRFSKADTQEAREFFMKAAVLDPGYARAHANLANTHAMDVFWGWSDDVAVSTRLATASAGEALRLDDGVPQVHFALSTLHLGARSHDAAIAAARRSIETNPNYADGYGMLAISLMYAGELAEAREAIAVAKHLNPGYPFMYLWIEGHTAFLAGERERALELLREASWRNLGFDAGHLVLAAAYATGGELEEAQWAVEQARALRPGLSVTVERSKSLYRRDEHRELYLQGLRTAGLPE